MADPYRWLGSVPPGAEKIRTRRRDRENKLALLRRWGLQSDGTRAEAEDSAAQAKKAAAVLQLLPGAGCRAYEGQAILTEAEARERLRVPTRADEGPAR